MSLLEGEVAASARSRPAMNGVRALMKSALALGLSILVFFPLFPSMPSSGLDPSWRLALNEAWARGLDFGRSMVFTYGPYAFLSTEQYHPATYPVLVICSLFLGAVLFLLLRHIEPDAKGGFRVPFILLCLIASGYTSSPDVRFLCYVFLLPVAAARPLSIGDRGVGLPVLLSRSVMLSVASFSLGAICLVKASYAVEVGAMGVLSMIVLYGRGQRLLPMALFISFALGLVFFWLAAGQSIAGLPRFVLSQVQVAAGYGQAMSRSGSLLPPVLFLISAIPLAIVIKRDLEPLTVGRYAVAIGMAITLFLSFKEGFVREDTWHVMIPAETLLILPWCWPSQRSNFWRKLQVAMAGSCVLIFILMFPYALDFRGKAARFEQLLHCSERGPIACPSQSSWLEKTYQMSLARIRLQVPLPKVEGTVDVYTVNQSLAIANGYRWDPRPVLQSYSAYTPALAQRNVEHLMGANAPDGVLFALEAIDGRLPAFADGPSWPILLTRYRADWLGIPAQPSTAAPIAYLRIKPDSQRLAVTSISILRGAVALGQVVNLPRADGVLFAKIDIDPSSYGRFESVLFRNSELYINFLFPGGRVERYRFIPGMARAGFIISPVITDAAQFVALRDLKVRQALSARRPIGFWLSGPASARWMWAHAAVIQISELRETRNQEALPRSSSAG